jgi:hypothetical protein
MNQKILNNINKCDGNAPKFVNSLALPQAEQMVTVLASDGKGVKRYTKAVVIGAGEDEDEKVIVTVRFPKKTKNEQLRGQCMTVHLPYIHDISLAGKAERSAAL